MAGYDASHRARIPRVPRWVGFGSSLPLLLVAAALFAGGYALRSTAATVGPGLFPLWDLLVVLGFVAGIGGVLSWFFVDSPEVGRVEDEGDTGAMDSRSESGRPRPETTSSRRPPMPTGGLAVALTMAGPPLPPWSEDDIPLTPPWIPPLPLAAGGPTVPSELRPDGIDQVLAEIDGIQRDAAARRSSEKAASP